MSRRGRILVAPRKRPSASELARYVRNYEIDEPLVVEMCGRYSPTMFQSLKDISLIADLAGSLSRHIRDRVAVALHIERWC